MIRFFDTIFSFLGLIILSPFFIIIALLIACTSRGNIFYTQSRVGKQNKDFTLFKFRTMSIGADKKGLLTVGMKDARITKVGGFLRKYKLDELPQLFNVLKGDMSLVGPRPEVRKYVDLYSDEQKRVLEVRPGITDYASIEYFDENRILAQSDNPEKQYIEEIMPRKLQLNLRYIENCSVKEYFRILFLTIKSVFIC
ncbi:MAG: sugar transferase [Bacteroidetes bacterium]|nr:sugar transferase [Bacteroidota bacterium]MCL2302039.1 sugar transferase [Lentimicrobiaceae bacterium]